MLKICKHEKLEKMQQMNYVRGEGKGMDPDSDKVNAQGRADTVLINSCVHSSVISCGYITGASTTVFLFLINTHTAFWPCTTHTVTVQTHGVCGSRETSSFFRNPLKIRS